MPNPSQRTPELRAGRARAAGPRSVGAALACMTLLATSQAAAVNAPKRAEPQRYQRVLLVGNLALVDELAPTATVGGIYQLSIVKSEVDFGGNCGGLGCVDPPSLYAHALGTGGISSDFESIDYAAFLQLGAMYRPYSDALPFLTAFGVALQGVMPSEGLGPVFRFELFENLGLQGGLLYFDVFDAGLDNPGWFVSLDYMYSIVDDLHLSP